MFTDLRGFTAFSENRAPELVIDALNRYFDETSDAILEHGGTLVAYRGDGFLAAFGAPIEVEDHADRALATARDMVDVRLPRFNEWLRSNGLGEAVRMGVGLNSGPFMSGNVGSLRRLEYTVHGDTVNTASRIEGLTKTLGGPILLSESTRAALLRPPADLRPSGGSRCADGSRPSRCGRSTADRKASPASRTPRRSSSCGPAARRARQRTQPPAGRSHGSMWCLRVMSAAKPRASSSTCTAEEVAEEAEAGQDPRGRGGARPRRCRRSRRPWAAFGVTSSRPSHGGGDRDRWKRYTRLAGEYISTAERPDGPTGSAGRSGGRRSTRR